MCKMEKKFAHIDVDALTMRKQRISPSGEDHQVKSPSKYSTLMAKPNMKSQPKQLMCAN